MTEIRALRPEGGEAMTRLLDSAERIVEAVIVVCALAVIAALLADQWGAVVWLGAG